jgi:ferredoxin
MSASLINSGVDLPAEVTYNRSLESPVTLSRTPLSTPLHPEPPIAPREVTVRWGGRIHHLRYQRGETLLDTMRRGGVWAPSNCEQGVCGTCMVRLIKGSVALRANHVLSDQDLAAGYTLACQGVPCDSVCEIELEG